MITKDNEPIYKRGDDHYVISFHGGEYSVRHKSVDPVGVYDIDEVIAYLLDHPEALVPEPVPLPPTQTELDARRIAEIKAEILRLDAATIRPMRAGEMDRVAEIEAQVVALRAEMAALV